MKILVTANGASFDSPTSPVFGRAPIYLFVDTETLTLEAVENPAISAAGGAGIQAAQYVIEHGAQAVLTGNVGPNAFQVFDAANIPVYLHSGGTVREIVDKFKAGQLQPAGSPNVASHTGMGAGRGMGRGMNIGRVAPIESGTPPTTGSAREEEISSLREAAAELRKQLAGIMDRLDKLEKGG